MKRSDFFIRLTTGVLFLAVACYIGVSLYNTLTNTFVTEPAISYAIEETLSAQGYIIRTESVLEDTGVAVLPIVAEGEKVAAGQAIAVEFLTPDALEMASEIRALNMKIAGLESARIANDAANFEAILALSAAVHTNDLRRLDELSLNVETGIFSIEDDIALLKARLEELEGRSVGTRTINAFVSGTFSHVVDGFEHIGPEILTHMVPGDLHAHFRTPYGTRGSGKLITDFKWYFAADMRHEEAIRISAGQTLVVQFLGAYQAEVSMYVESISRREDDRSVVIFSSDRGIHDVAPLRSIRAEIVLDVISGIRVPKAAIHLDDDGTTFVYLQTSGYAEKVEVEILKITEDNYLVRDGAETDSPLRVDSIIIVRANNLYHGKVVG